MRIRTGDLVQVVSGADRGRQGKVLSVDRAARRLREALRGELSMDGWMETQRRRAGWTDRSRAAEHPLAVLEIKNASAGARQGGCGRRCVVS